MADEKKGQKTQEQQYDDPAKGSSTKPGTKALARQRVAELARGDQTASGEARTMGMSRGRRDAYAAAEAAGNK